MLTALVLVVVVPVIFLSVSPVKEKGRSFLVDAVSIGSRTKIKNSVTITRPCAYHFTSVTLNTGVLDTVASFSQILGGPTSICA